MSDCRCILVFLTLSSGRVIYIFQIEQTFATTFTWWSAQLAANVNNSGSLTKSCKNNCLAMHSFHSLALSCWVASTEALPESKTRHFGNANASFNALKSWKLCNSVCCSSCMGQAGVPRLANGQFAKVKKLAACHTRSKSEQCVDSESLYWVKQAAHAEMWTDVFPDLKSEQLSDGGIFPGLDQALHVCRHCSRVQTADRTGALNTFFCSRLCA